MITSLKHEFLWVDLETTGLDPARDQILEWAACLVADDRGGDFAIVEAYGSVVYCEPERRDKADPYVRQMHDANGLWAECAASDVTISEADAFLAERVRDLGAQPRSVMLAGASVYFDLAFVHAHMPKLAFLCSHRVFDVSTLTRAESSWGSELPRAPRESHRAMADIVATIADAKAWRDRRYHVTTK